MLKVRVIPTLLWSGPGLVKGVGFHSWRRIGTILPAVKVYNRRDVDELIIVDIAASSNGTMPDVASVADFSRECSVPLTMGGGITSVEDATRLLKAGADKISVNTAAYERPTLITEIAERLGVQCVVASIDAVRSASGDWVCMSCSGTRDTGKDPVTWARELAALGAGEILLTSVDRDGTLGGYDVDLVSTVSAAVDVPVIASGGAGTYQHMIDVVQHGAAAVAAASMFHFTEQTPAGARSALMAAGIPVRRAFEPVPARTA